MADARDSRFRKAGETLQPMTTAQIMDGPQLREMIGLAGKDGCLIGDALIDIPRDLRAYPGGVPIRELVGTTPLVYGERGGRITLARAHSIHPTGHRQICRATLRPGQRGPGQFSAPMELTGTPDHLVMQIDGSWKPLGDLRPGDHLRSLYRRSRDGEYVKINRNDGTFALEHRMVASVALGRELLETEHAHHLNGIRIDNREENCLPLSYHDHFALHGARRPPTYTEHPRGMLGKHHSAEVRARIAESMRHVRRAESETASQENHIVVNVETAGAADVFDIIVPELENFVANGIVVHNSGKSCAIVSFAAYIEAILNPDARFFVIDTENKFKSALRSFGPDAPQNITYYHTPTMNDVTEAIQIVLKEHRPGDWLGVESLARMWERAQDLGYQSITGTGKAAYLDRRREHAQANPNIKELPVTPRPDDLWSIVKGAHDGAFIDLLTAADDLNVIMSTTVDRVREERSNRKENVDRKETRAEFGIDMNLGGAPRLAYYFETLCLTGMDRGVGFLRVVRDNLSSLDDSRIEFDVKSRKDWGAAFFEHCRS